MSIDITHENCYIPEPAKMKILCYQEHDITIEKCMRCGKQIVDIINDKAGFTPPIGDDLPEFGCVATREEKHTPASLSDQRLAGHYYENVTYPETVHGHICMDCWEDLPTESGD